MATILMLTVLALELVSASPLPEASSPGPGDLLVDEFLADPKAVQDRFGEYFVIRNVSPRFVAIEGLVVRDGKSDHLSIATDVILAPGERLVLGPNPDRAANGGIPVDYTYHRFSLSNESDSIVLEWDGIEIDSVDYDRRLGWPIRPGTVLSLEPLLWDPALNDVPTAWTPRQAPEQRHVRRQPPLPRTEFGLTRQGSRTYNPARYVGIEHEHCHTRSHDWACCWTGGMRDGDGGDRRCGRVGCCVG